MKVIKWLGLFIALLLNTSLAWTSDSSPKGCLYEGKSVAPFESIWVDDPFLVKEFVDHHRASGATEKDIYNRLKNSDWTGFRLVCHPVVSYQAPTIATLPAQGFKITSYALTFNEYSMDFYLSIQKQITEKETIVTP